MTTFLDSPITLEQLSDKSLQNLAKVSDYPLDYNIFLFKGIDQSRSEDLDELTQFRKSVLDSIPKDYGDLIFDAVGANQLELTTIARLQNRLLKLLILERHRRDIEILNRMISEDPKLANKKISYIQLKEPLKYEIKSPIYKSFENNRDLYKESFRKFALLQNVEYDFEHLIDDNGDYQTDDDLLEAFCTDDILDFNDKMKENKDKDYDTIEDVVANSKIGKVLVPLAAQAFFTRDDDEKDEKDEKDD
ncbi:hypothetical protein FOA43_004037 [Brettanomyces nanus]|uniref:Uncharacterized protein n=1 Tax=Eeniella nana TaxID=13502 RepID=A0A875S8Z3_EENNA|nr:uncharacterized protein FOA43_004037 [Brettanomyces nanus]QPG76645.1 hypothetical protein FOA43_004037 [Brettanomyces nanus]